MKQHQKKMLNEYLENGEFSVKEKPFWIDTSSIEFEDDIFDESE
jgi:hypothetical protein